MRPPRGSGSTLPLAAETGPARAQENAATAPGIIPPPGRRRVPGPFWGILAGVTICSFISRNIHDRILTPQDQKAKVFA